MKLRTEGDLTLWSALKYLFAAIYANFTTTIHDTGDMTPVDNYLAGPKGNRVEVKFHFLESET